MMKTSNLFVQPQDDPAPFDPAAQCDPDAVDVRCAEAIVAENTAASLAFVTKEKRKTVNKKRRAL